MTHVTGRAKIEYITEWDDAARIRTATVTINRTVADASDPMDAAWDALNQQCTIKGRIIADHEWMDGPHFEFEVEQ